MTMMWNFEVISSDKRSLYRMELYSNFLTKIK